MNREQRRNFTQKVKRVGIEERVASTMMDIIKSGVGVVSVPNQSIKTGDIVRLDIAKVMARKNYEKMAPAYQEFVANSRGKVFHAVDEGHNTIHVEEAPNWLFWSDDLIKINHSDEDMNADG